MTAAVAVADGIQVRPADIADVPFIRDSWVRSFLHAHRHTAAKDAPAVRDTSTRLLQRANALVLADPEDATHVAGYAVFERPEGLPVLHYLYVKHPLRRLGLGALLLDAAGFSAGGHYTHHTEALEPLARRFRLHFSPRKAE
jgi:ribosomal protein S18 acetylase RimI-like enzyme